MRKITIGTRGSRLALAQTESVADSLRALYPDSEFEIIIIKTKGDKILDAPLSRIGDKGLFTREIEEEMLKGKIDMAVHSMKDMPTELPLGLRIGATTIRINPSDVLISKNGIKISDLSSVNTIATSSLRRRAQLQAVSPGIGITDIRGNINTRIRKMQENPGIDGIILAHAGLARLDMTEMITEILDTDIFIPAVGQASLAVETRDDDPFIDSVLAPLHHAETGIEVSCEREFLSSLEGGCQVPIAGYARIQDTRITLTGMVASLDGRTVFRDSISMAVGDHAGMGRELAGRLLGMGADRVLDEIYGRTDTNTEHRS